MGIEPPNIKLHLKLFISMVNFYILLWNKGAYVGSLEQTIQGGGGICGCGLKSKIKSSNTFKTSYPSKKIIVYNIQHTIQSTH